MSSAYHPQSDGQTEVLNRVIEQYLHAFVHHRPGTWGKLIPWVEWSNNSSWNVATGTTPYEITSGRKSFSFSEYVVGTSKLDVVDELLTERDATFQAIRRKLEKAQENMKKFADVKHREVIYQVGDWVLLKLRPYRQHSAKGTTTAPAKLAKRYYGPFKILERLGEVAYCLQLPEGARIHPVFHYSVLKPCHGTPNDQQDTLLPTQAIDGQPMITLISIMDSRRRSNDDTASWEVLVQWQGLSPNDTSWED